MSYKNKNKKKKTLSTDAGGETEAMNPKACHSVHILSSVNCLS